MKYSTVLGRSELPYKFFLGGRGIGKTFSVLDGFTSNIMPYFPKDSKLMFMRRNETEVETMVAKDVFKKLKKKDKALTYSADYSKTVGIGNIWSDLDKKENVGYISSLATFSRSRGVDGFADISHYVFDELSPEVHKTYIRNEGIVFLNMLESLMRNRELEGLPPVDCYFLSNAIRLDTPIFRELELVSIIQNMITSGQHRYSDKNRGIYIELMENKELAEAKAETSLYKLAGKNSRFARQALLNEFIFDDLSIVRKAVVKEFYPYIVYGSYTVYRHKSQPRFYIANTLEKCKTVLASTQSQLFRELFGMEFRHAIARHLLNVDDYNTFIVIATALNYKL
ncbi:MAG TPA: hypothetical protein DEB74_05980 [Lachnospiraceae bacterium]|nr:hypothetical protein [Lachnospiraceae bacterium]